MRDAVRGFQIIADIKFDCRHFDGDVRKIAEYRCRFLQRLLLIETRIDDDQVVLGSGRISPIAVDEALETVGAEFVPGQIDDANRRIIAPCVGGPTHVRPRLASAMRWTEAP